MGINRTPTGGSRTPAAPLFLDNYWETVQRLTQEEAGMDSKFYKDVVAVVLLALAFLALVLYPWRAHSFETSKNALRSGSTPAAYQDYVNGTRQWFILYVEKTTYRHQFSFIPYFENATGNYTYAEYMNATEVNGTFGVYGDDGGGEFKYLGAMSMNGTPVEFTGWFDRFMVVQLGSWQGSSPGASFFVFPRYRGGK